MKLYLKYICVPFLILLSGMTYAQNPECVTVRARYSMALSETASMNGEAAVTFQDKAFHMTGEGFDVYCDGTDIWTVDIAAKEVYIEALGEENEEYLLDTARALAGMEPQTEANFLTPDEQIVRIEVLSLQKTDAKDISSFRPSQNFDSSWVVTDLR